MRHTSSGHQCMLTTVPPTPSTAAAVAALPYLAISMLRQGGGELAAYRQGGLPATGEQANCFWDVQAKPWPR